MRTQIIRIGNSRGIRIPKVLLEECGLDGEVELETRAGRLTVRPAVRPRAGWEEAFRRMAARRDDRLLDSPRIPSTRWEATEWEW